jgi:hypothetical protein
MGFTIPTVDQFKAQFFRGFPFAVPAWGATATVVITSGVVTAVNLATGGQGYTTAPTVAVTPVQGDISGGGAILTPTVAAGSVTGLAITDGGSGYIQPPSVTFSGGAGDPTNPQEVQDTDIQGAITDAQYNINEGLFATQDTWNRGFLYLAAHQLVEKLLMDAEGTQSQYAWLTTAKSVADVNESFQIPDRISADPFLAHLSKTRYGAMYLQIISPQLIGNVITAFRFTLP